jgi:hypothetical protein
VLDYLAISEVIETMEDLVQFVKDLRDVLTNKSSSDYTVKMAINFTVPSRDVTNQTLPGRE